MSFGNIQLPQHSLVLLAPCIRLCLACFHARLCSHFSPHIGAASTTVSRASDTRANRYGVPSVFVPLPLCLLEACRTYASHFPPSPSTHSLPSPRISLLSAAPPHAICWRGGRRRFGTGRQWSPATCGDTLHTHVCLLTIAARRLLMLTPRPCLLSRWSGGIALYHT